MRFGLLVSGGDGHLNPLLALGSSLQESSHYVTFFALPDNLTVGTFAGIEVIECAASRVPMGSVSSITKHYATGTPPKKSSGALVQDNMVREAYLLAVDDWLTIKRLSVGRLHKAIKEILSNNIYSNNVLAFAKLIDEKPGITLAQEAIEQLLTQ